MRWKTLVVLALGGAILALGACAAPPADPLPEPAEVLQEKPVDSAGRFTLVAVGDLMVHEEQLQEARSGVEYDFTHCFAPVEPDLAEGDITMGNLETVFGGQSLGYEGYPLFNTPDSFGTALAAAGFDLVTTANNHCLDRGVPGLERTLEVLDSLGIAHTGTFASPAGREEILMLEAGGARIAFLAYTAGTNAINPAPGKEYLVNYLEEWQVVEDLRRARALRPDLVVVLPHMGREYEAQPDGREIRRMDMLLQNGADVVLASHPHVLQPMELRNGSRGIVHYSLGNLLSSQRQEPRDTGIILKLDFVREAGRAVLERVRFVPTWVQFRDNRDQPLIRVLPIGDALEAPQEYLLHPADRDRLVRAHSQITAQYLGEAIPATEARHEYIFYER